MELAIDEQPLESLPMEMSRKAGSHIVQSLIRMYKDSLSAAIREYSSNALDSHIKAGNTAPIEVTLPTSENPNLVIKDYGVGLDRDGLGTFVLIGESTKQASPGETGKYGMGCKSALALAPYFTVLAVKDKVERFVKIGENKDGKISLDILEMNETDAPDGVTITIPVEPQRHWETKKKAQDYFASWEPGTVLVNGEKPYHIAEYEGYEKFGKHALYSSAETFGRKVEVKMGSVVYPIDMSEVEYNNTDGFEELVVNRDYNILFETEIGTLDIILNRDSLTYTKETSNHLVSLIKEFNQTFHDKMMEDFNNFTDYSSAEKTILKWVGQASHDYVTQYAQWNGLPYNTSIHTVDNEGWIVTATLRQDDKMSYYGKEGYVRSYTFSPQSDKTVYVAVEKEEAPRVIRRSKTFIEGMRNIRGSNIRSVVYIVGAAHDNPWVTENDTYTYADLDTFNEVSKTWAAEKRRLNRENGVNNNNRTATSYVVAQDGEQLFLTANEIKELYSDLVYYWETEQTISAQVINHASQILGMKSEPVVFISGQKTVQGLRNKFKNVELVNIAEVLKEILENHVFDGQEEARQKIGLEDSYIALLAKNIEVDTLKNDEFKKAVTFVQNCIEENSDYQPLRKLAFYLSPSQGPFSLTSRRLTREHFAVVGLEEWCDQRIKERYPLIRLIPRYDIASEIQAIAAYMDAMSIQMA